MAAAALGLAPGAIRRRNLVPAAAMPFKTAIGTNLDSGDFALIMDSAEEMAELGDFEARKADSEARGRRRGLGYGNLLEPAGPGSRTARSCPVCRTAKFTCALAACLTDSRMKLFMPRCSVIVSISI